MSTAACDCLRKDHREMENHLDALMAAVSPLTADRVPAVERSVAAIRQLSAVHFAREEGIFYPRLRTAIPDLLAQMDEQHEHVREVEQHVADMLASRPHDPDDRWLWELRAAAIEFHDWIQHHIVDEEDHLLRLAEKELSPAEQEELASRMSALG